MHGQVAKSAHAATCTCLHNDNDIDIGTTWLVISLFGMDDWAKFQVSQI